MILMRYKEKYNNCIFSAAKPKSRVKPTFLACAENVNQRFPIKNNFANTHFEPSSHAGFGG